MNRDLLDIIVVFLKSHLHDPIFGHLDYSPIDPNRVVWITALW